MYYYIEKDRIDFEAYADNDRIIRFKYFVLENYLECIKGNCKNYQPEIDYILTEYQAISSIL